MSTVQPGVSTVEKWLKSHAVNICRQTTGLTNTCPSFDRAISYMCTHWVFSYKLHLSLSFLLCSVTWLQRCSPQQYTIMSVLLVNRACPQRKVSSHVLQLAIPNSSNPNHHLTVSGCYGSTISTARNLIYHHRTSTILHSHETHFKLTSVQMGLCSIMLCQPGITNPAVRGNSSWSGFFIHRQRRSKVVSNHMIHCIASCIKAYTVHKQSTMCLLTRKNRTQNNLTFAFPEAIALHHHTARDVTWNAAGETQSSTIELQYNIFWNCTVLGDCINGWLTDCLSHYSLSTI